MRPKQYEASDKNSQQWVLKDTSQSPYSILFLIYPDAYYLRSFKFEKVLERFHSAKKTFSTFFCLRTLCRPTLQSGVNKAIAIVCYSASSFSLISLYRFETKPIPNSFPEPNSFGVTRISQSPHSARCACRNPLRSRVSRPLHTSVKPRRFGVVSKPKFSLQAMDFSPSNRKFAYLTHGCGSKRKPQETRGFGWFWSSFPFTNVGFFRAPGIFDPQPHAIMGSDLTLNSTRYVCPLGGCLEHWSLVEYERHLSKPFPT